MAAPTSPADGNIFPPKEALNHFLATFGEPDEVKKEALQFMQEQGRVSSPTELYRHLLHKRAESGKISGQRAGIQQAVFTHTFIPEHGTGYLAKHRDSLVSGIAELYSKEGNSPNPVWRIEGDVSNLRGLNDAMIGSAKNLYKSDKVAFNAMLDANGIRTHGWGGAKQLGRKMADRVLHAISDMTLESLEKKADVIPLRKGGDEISFIATIKQGVTEHEMKDTLQEIKEKVARFAVDSGLELIAYGKDPSNRRRSGIGIGLHMLDMRKLTPEEQRHHMDLGITYFKEQSLRAKQYPHRGDKNPPMTIPDMTTMAKVLEGYSETPPMHTVIPNLNAPGDATPDEQRLINLKNIMAKAEGGALSPAEEKALVGTHALIRKIDAVTSLPMFEHAQEEQLPYCMEKYGKSNGGLKLINVDYNNMAGGNRLSEDIGNAMGAAYARSFIKAMNLSGLSEYSEGLSVRPGGKFTLLVPASITYEAIAGFDKSLKSALKEVSEEPLKISEATRNAVRDKIGANNELRNMYGPKSERLFDENGQISIARIMNSKYLQGARVAMAVSAKPIDPEKSLGGQLAPLESKADILHKEISNARKAAGETLSPSAANAVNSRRESAFKISPNREK